MLAALAAMSLASRDLPSFSVVSTATGHVTCEAQPYILPDATSRKLITAAVAHQELSEASVLSINRFVVAAQEYLPDWTVRLYFTHSSLPSDKRRGSAASKYAGMLVAQGVQVYRLAGPVLGLASCLVSRP